MSAAASSLRKQELLHRSSLARIHLRREIRALRAALEPDRSSPARYPLARLAAGVALSMAGPRRAGEVLTRMRRGLGLAKLALVLLRFFGRGVRNRTDAAGGAP